MKQLLISCLLLSALGLGTQRLPAATSSESQPSDAELLKQVQALAAKVDQLEEQAGPLRKGFAHSVRRRP
jgi:outer membrane murein-binding lipoprotein Lpp